MTDRIKTVTLSPAEQMREAAAQKLDQRHAIYMAGKGRDPSKYESEYSLLAREIRAIPLPPEPSPLDDPRVKALVEAATPYVSPVQNADFGRQLRQHDALDAALRGLTGEGGE